MITRESSGLLVTTTSFLFWGLTPLYWKLLPHVGPWEIIAHRAVWTALLTLLLLPLLGQGKEWMCVLRQPRMLGILAFTSILLGGNGVVYVWAVANDHVLEASLAYFLVPVINLLMGVLFLGERLTRWQAVAATIAALGVAMKVFATGTLPWVALVLGLSFGLYGFVRKKLPVGSVPGLNIEMALLTVPGVAFLLWLATRGSGALGHTGWATDLLLVGSGPVTAIPLLLFALGARRIPLSTVGILQYLAPSVMFGVGWALGEVLRPLELAAFGLVWTGLVVYTAESLTRLRARPAISQPN